MSKSLLLVAAGASAGAAFTTLFYRQQGSSTTASPKQLPLQRPPAQSTTQKPLQHAPVSAQPPVNPSGWFAYGPPGPISDIAPRTSLMSSYDRRMRNPAWVAEHITAESLALSGGDRKFSVFKEDESIPEKFRAKLKDYFRSGYDRGHQVPAADAKFSQQAMDETFYLSNMSPQVGDGFNRDYWAHFEDFCRRLTSKYSSVRIVTGPLYLPRLHPDGKYRVTYEVIGDPANVAVPTHFFKLIVGEPAGSSATEGPLAIGAFVMPNAPIDNSTPLTEFYVPVEIVERASGLDLLPLIAPNRRRSLCKDVKCDILVREFKKSAGKQSK